MLSIAPSSEIEWKYIQKGVKQRTVKHQSHAINDFNDEWRIWPWCTLNTIINFSGGGGG